MNSVLQPWLESIPLMMQSTLILSLRGPDTHACPNIKKIIRWMRGLAFKPGNPANVTEFMGELPERIVEKGPTAKELEFCSQHFYSHLMHGLEVIAYCCPKTNESFHALLLYKDMCALFHLDREDEIEFRHRLRERPWPGDGQPIDYDEAIKLLEEKQ
jgi:hypothetical protein